MKIINKKSEKSLIDQFIKDFKKDYLRKKKTKQKIKLCFDGWQKSDKAL